MPFYLHPLGRPGRPTSGRERTGGWRGGFLLGALEVALKEDLRKHLATMQRLQLLLDLFGVDWSHVWLQPLDGSVNIMPSLELQARSTHSLGIHLPVVAHKLAGAQQHKP